MEARVHYLVGFVFAVAPLLVMAAPVALSMAEAAYREAEKRGIVEKAGRFIGGAVERLGA